MKKIGMLFLSVLFFGHSYSQNKIKNPSFEDSLPTKNWYTHFLYCNHKEDLMLCTNLSNPNSEDHITFLPQDGKVCVAIELYYVEIKGSDYIVNQIEPLEKGKSYTYTFYITPSDSSGYSVNNIDVLFCDSKFLQKNISCLQPQKIYVEPTLSFDISMLRKQGEEGKWLKLSAKFIAKGNENVMVIGNFSDPHKIKYYTKRKLSFKKSKDFRESSKYGSIYYLDNFSLTAE